MNVGGALLFSTCPSVHCCGHSNLVIFNRTSFKFHMWMASIKLWFRLEYEFCPTNSNKDFRENGHPPIRVLCLGHSNLVIFNQISSKFQIGIVFDQTLVQVQVRVLFDEQ